MSTQNVQSEVTALIIAATAHRPGCLHLLLKSGADKDVTDNVRDTLFSNLLLDFLSIIEAQSAGVLLMIRFLHHVQLRIFMNGFFILKHRKVALR